MKLFNFVHIFKTLLLTKLVIFKRNLDVDNREKCSNLRTTFCYIKANSMEVN